MELRTCSHALPLAKMAKVFVKGLKPQVDIPAATPVMLHSAMPMSKKRSGYFAAKPFVIVAPAKSASKTTSSGYFSASSTSASP